MRNLRSINTALHGSVLVLAVLCLTLGSIACSSGNSGEGTKWGTMGKGSAQKSPASSLQSHSSVLDLPLDGTLRGTVKDEEGQPLQGFTERTAETTMSTEAWLNLAIPFTAQMKSLPII